MSKHKMALATVVSLATVGLIMMAVSLPRVHASPQQRNRQATADSASGGNKRPGETIDDEYLEWPLAPEDKAYGVINGKHLKQYAAEIVAIRERYRDQGHQFWGTITGTSSDVETQQWVLNKFKQIGLETRVIEHPLPPQFIPKSWEITASGNGKTLQFPSAFPVNNIPGTPSQGLDLEAVYVGTGSEAEYAGRNVQGKAVFIYNNARNHANFSALAESGTWPASSSGTDNAMIRAEHQGAAAVFLIFAVPGNIKAYLYRVWPNGAHVPTFSIGLDDGLAMRDLLGNSSGATPHVKVRIDATPVLNLKTATILGTLPGMTDETIYLTAHRDAVFDGASDNASGVVAMMGLAEYFAKVPKTQRKRTIVFVAETGHHNNCKDEKGPCSISLEWMSQHHDEFFEHTALIINLEHVANSQTYIYMGVGKSDASQEALFWSAKGSDNFADLCYKTLREFGVPTYSEGNNFGIGNGNSGIFKYSPAAIELINLGLYSHTDNETLDDLPWTGLQAVTRAYAKIITMTNGMDIKQLETEAAEGSN